MDPLRTYYSGGGLRPSLSDYPHAWYAKQFNENESKVAAYCSYLYGGNRLRCITITAVGPLTTVLDVGLYLFIEFNTSRGLRARFGQSMQEISIDGSQDS